MPETRYREVYEQGTGKLIATESYIVTDEELAREKALDTIQKLKVKGKGNWTLSDLRDLLEAFLITQLG